MRVIGWLAFATLALAACSPGSSTQPTDSAASETATGDAALDIAARDVAADAPTFADIQFAIDAPPTDVTMESAVGFDAGSVPDASGSGDTGARPTDAANETGPHGTDAGPCGVCPSGFSCTAAGLCETPTGIPAFGNVYLIMMENRSQSSLRGSSSAPYINGLLGSAAIAGTYTSITHPSLPNYIAITSGDPQNIGCDCQPGVTGSSCSFACLLFNTCDCNKDVPHLADQIEDASLSWREYGESMGSPCNTGNTGSYVARHIPFLYYDNVRDDTARCNAHIVDYNQFMADRGHYSFSMISPDLCHDMHDSCAPTSDAIRQGDDWLAANVPRITGAPGFATNGVLFIVWDEGNLSLSDSVVAIVISPMAVTAYTSSAAYNHYSLLGTIEDGLGLPRMAGSVGAPVMSDLFR